MLAGDAATLQGAPFWLTLVRSPWAKVLLAVGVIVALVAFNRIDLQSFSGLSKTWGWLILAFALMIPSYAIVSYRFWRVLGTQGIPSTFSQALRWTMIGSFFDIAMPSNSGGDVVKAAYIVRHVGAGQRTSGVMAVAFDRVIGLLGLFLLAALASIAGWNTVRLMPGSTQLVAFLVAVSLGSLLLFRILGSRTVMSSAFLSRWVERVPAGARLINVIGSFNRLRERPADFFVVVGLSILNHALWCGSLLCITEAFGNHVALLRGFTVFPLAIFSNVFGFAGGFGVGTAAFDVIFDRLLSIHVGAAIGLTFQLLSAVSRLIGLPFYLASDTRRRG